MTTPDMLFLLDHLTWPSFAAFLAQDIFTARINEATALADGWSWKAEHLGWFLDQPSEFQYAFTTLRDGGLFSLEE